MLMVIKNNITTRVISSTIILLSLVSCDDNLYTIDLSEYIIPQVNKSQLLKSYNKNIIINNINYNSTLLVEYKPGYIHEELYDFQPYNIVKVKGVTPVLPKREQVNTTYTFNDNWFYAVQNNLNYGYSFSYLFHRYVMLNKTYTNGKIGTFFSPTPQLSKRDSYTDVFIRDAQRDKDCIIHTRIVFSKDSKSERESRIRHDYTYCKLYGLVQENIFEKGVFTERLKIKNMSPF